MRPTSKLYPTHDLTADADRLRAVKSGAGMGEMATG
jgi:hypothetical protein